MILKNLVARNNFVILRPDPINDISEGGLHLVSNRSNNLEDETAIKATVVQAGPGTYQNGILVPLDLKPGDRVLYDPRGSVRVYMRVEEESKLFVNGKEKKKGGLEELALIQEINIFGKFEE